MMETENIPTPKITLDALEGARFELLIKIYAHMKASTEIMLTAQAEANGVGSEYLDKYKQKAAEYELQTLDILGFNPIRK